MARRSSSRGKMAALASLRVLLIPVQKDSFDGDSHRKVVQHLISLMVLNLHKRGRPKKNAEGEIGAHWGIWDENENLKF